MESLPKQFVSAMRTLFDIMDDKHTGYVRLTDIENRWRDDRTKGLPRGVVESLQKVASHDGLLTFDRFCSGLKICLLRNQVESSSKTVDDLNTNNDKIVTHSSAGAKHRPPSAPILEPNHKMDRNWSDIQIADTVTQHRTLSMPLLMPRKDIQVQDNHGPMQHANRDHNVLYPAGPPKPPRLEKNVTERGELQRCGFKSEEETFEIEEIMNSDQDVMRTIEKSRGHGDGRPNTELSQFQVSMRKPPRRREPRRHTLHNGVDYNLLKRMKQIEQEKDILLQGLGSVEEAREWYLKQLSEVQEKMRYAGRMGAYVEPWSESQHERLELLRARVLELNRQLGALAAGHPPSLHMNLALPAASARPAAAPAPPVLRTQNQMLLEEVNRKNERITILEREKSALIRELLLQRNRTKLMDNVN